MNTEVKHREVPAASGMQIYKTKNYDQFYLINGNRDIDEKHVQRLIESMTDEECISPVQVNEKMELIDGQHRFRALEKMGRYVYYYIVKGANVRTVQKLNTTVKQWDRKSFLKSNVDLENEDYIQYKEFEEKFKLGHIADLLLLSGSTSSNNLRTLVEEFSANKFEVKDMKGAIKKAEMLLEIKPFYKGYRSRSFLLASLICWKNKQFDWSKFVHKCSYQQKKLITCSTVEQALEMIEEVYNYNQKKEDKLILRTAK